MANRKELKKVYKEQKHYQTAKEENIRTRSSQLSKKWSIKEDEKGVATITSRGRDIFRMNIRIVNQ